MKKPLTFERFLEDIDLVMATHAREEIVDFYYDRFFSNCTNYNEAIKYVAGLCRAAKQEYPFTGSLATANSVITQRYFPTAQEFYDDEDL